MFVVALHSLGYRASFLAKSTKRFRPPYFYDRFAALFIATVTQDN